MERSISVRGRSPAVPARGYTSLAVAGSGPLVIGFHSPTSGRVTCRLGRAGAVNILGRPNGEEHVNTPGTTPRPLRPSRPRPDPDRHAGLERRLARYPPLHSRIGFVDQYRPLDRQTSNLSLVTTGTASAPPLALSGSAAADVPSDDLHDVNDLAVSLGAGGQVQSATAPTSSSAGGCVIPSA